MRVGWIVRGLYTVVEERTERQKEHFWHGSDRK